MSEEFIENMPEIKPDLSAAVKMAGDWELDVLGVPFGGPNDGKDSDGQWFSPKTEVHADLYPVVPAVYYHGLDPSGRPMGDPEIIGKARYLRVGPEGHWYRVVLDKSSTLAGRIWDAAKQGVARASSGTIAYLARLLVGGVKRLYDKLLPGEITNWPVVELTLIDATGKRQPANPFSKVPFWRNSTRVPVGASITWMSSMRHSPASSRPRTNSFHKVGPKALEAVAR